MHQYPIENWWWIKKDIKKEIIGFIQTSLLLEKDDLDRFLDAMSNNKTYWDKNGKAGMCIPLYNVNHFNHYEYTDEMKKADEEKANALKEQEEKKEEDKK